MVFKRKAPRRKFVRRRTTRRRKPRMSLAKMVQKVIDRTKQVKHTQLEYSFAVTNGYTLLMPISYPAQGIKAFDNYQDDNDEEGQRIGNTIFPKSFQFNYSLEAGDSTNFLRITIFEWLLPTSASDEVPTSGDIFENPATGFAYLSPLNYDNRKNYHILHDKVYKMVTGAANQIMSGKLTFTVRKLRVKKWIFTGDSQTGVEASLVKGNIYMFAVSDSSILPHPSFSYSTRLTYTD